MISIIIPTYKREKEVNALVDYIFSLKSHGIKFEVIIVNDDKEKIKVNKKAKLISNSKNLGGHVSRGKGFKVSKGSHIIFLDDDDMPNPDFFKILTNINKDKDIVYFDLNIENKNNKATHVPFKGKLANKPWLQNTLFQNKVFSRRIIKEEYFTPIRLYQDENLFFKAIDENTKYQIINNWIILYKYNPGSVSKTHDHSKRYERILDNYNDFLSKDTLMYKYARGRLYSFLVFWNTKYKLKKDIKNIKKKDMLFTPDDRGRLTLVKIMKIFLGRWK